MAEHVARNYNVRKCRGTMKCECGTVSKFCFTLAPGFGSQRTEGHQCPSCRKIVALTIHGSGKIAGPDVKQKPYGTPVPCMPPDPDKVTK